MEKLNKLKEGIGKGPHAAGDVLPSILDEIFEGHSELSDPSRGFGKILGEAEVDLSKNESYDYVIGYSIGLVIIAVILWRLLS